MLQCSVPHNKQLRFTYQHSSQLLHQYTYNRGISLLVLLITGPVTRYLYYPENISHKCPLCSRANLLLVIPRLSRAAICWLNIEERGAVKVPPARNEQIVSVILVLWFISLNTKYLPILYIQQQMLHFKYKYNIYIIYYVNI